MKTSPTYHSCSTLLKHLITVFFAPLIGATSLLFFTAAISTPSFAGTFKVIARDGTVWFDQTQTWTKGTSVGKVTFDTLTNAVKEKLLTDFKGFESGVLSINDLGNDMVVISDTEMKAYGWCFSVDKIAPDTMADETPLTTGKEDIVWFYAFAHLKDGNWISQCERD